MMYCIAQSYNSTVDWNGSKTKLGSLEPRGCEIDVSILLHGLQLKKEKCLWIF